MQYNIRATLVILGIALLGFGSSLFASGVPTVSKQTAATNTVPGYHASVVDGAYRSALDGGETFTNLEATDATATSAACVSTITAAGVQNISVNAHMSASGATVALTAVGYSVGDLALVDQATSTLVAKTMHTVTLTGGATFTENSLYPSTSTWTFDTGGIPIWKIYAADPSSGTATLYVEVH